MDKKYCYGLNDEWFDGEGTYENIMREGTKALKLSNKNDCDFEIDEYGVKNIQKVYIQQ